MIMSETLTAFETTIDSDGRWETPAPISVKKGTRVMITVLEEVKVPNAVTRAAMEEPAEGSGYETVDELMEALRS